MEPDRALTEPAEDLDDWLDGDEPPWDDEPEPPPDAMRANGMLRRVARIRAERQRDAQLATAQLEQVAAWVDARDAPRVRQEAWLLAALRRYHEAVLVISPASKTIGLPAGDLVSRMGQAEWVAEPAFEEWVLPVAAREALAAAEAAWVKTVTGILAEHSPLPGALVVKQPPLPGIGTKPMKDELTRRDEKGKAVQLGVTAKGEVPPGLTITPPERNFDVKVRTADNEPEPDYPEPEAHGA